jgi:hypothetical protein
MPHASSLENSACANADNGQGKGVVERTRPTTGTRNMTAITVMQGSAHFQPLK